MIARSGVAKRPCDAPRKRALFAKQIMDPTAEPRPRNDERRRFRSKRAPKSGAPTPLPMELVNKILVNVADVKRFRWRFVHNDISGMMRVRENIKTHWIFLNDTSYDNPYAFPWKVNYTHAERLPMLVAVDEDE